MGLPAAVTTERAIETPVYLVPEAKRHSTNGAGHPYDVVQAAWRIRTAERNRQLDEIEYVVTRIVPTRRKNVDDPDIGYRRELWFRCFTPPLHRIWSCLFEEQLLVGIFEAAVDFFDTVDTRIRRIDQPGTYNRHIRTRRQKLIRDI